MKYIERAYPWLLVAPAALPVVVWGGLIYPYLVPKTLLFYALSFITLGAFLILSASGRAFYWGRLNAWPAWIPGALVALAYLASALGIDFYRSFWSLFVRGDGLLMLTCAAACFYLVLLYADSKFFGLLTRCAAVVGSTVALYGIWEWLADGGRIGSLLGNAAFFAGYLGIAFFATLLCANALAGFWRRAAYAGAALEIVAITLSATRGTMLALGVAAFVALAYLAAKAEGKTRMRAGTAVLTLVILAGGFFALRSELAHMPFAPIARLASIGTNDPDVASRLFIWKNMLGQIGRSPLVGYGAEHIDVLFNRFYNPTQIEEEWFDRSHNAFLDYAAQYGIGGLLLYLALIGSFFFAARRLAARGEPRLAGILALLAVVYAVQNFFVFDTISSFWLLLALLAGALALAGPTAPARPLTLPRAAVPAAWAAALVLAALIYPVSVRPAIAAYDLAHAYAWAVLDPSRSDAYFENGFSLSTYGDVEYGYEAYDVYVNHQRAALSGDSLDRAYRDAESILASNFRRYPYDARTALYLAHVLSAAPTSAAPDNDLLATALASAIRGSPDRYQAWYILANLAITRANTYPVGSSGRSSGYAAATDLMTKYVAVVPALAEPHFVLAELARASGDPQTAASEAALGKRYYKSDLPTARRAAGYFEGTKDWSDARFFLSEVVHLDPSDHASAYDLAKVTYLSGDPAAADAIVAELRREAPSILPSDPNFMAAIAAYERSR